MCALLYLSQRWAGLPDIFDPSFSSENSSLIPMQVVALEVMLGYIIYDSWLVLSSTMLSNEVDDGAHEVILHHAITGGVCVSFVPTWLFSPLC